MFVIQDNKKIILTKGDTATISISIVDLDNKEYEIQEDDVITLTIRKTPSSPIVLQKTAEQLHYIIFNPEDTVDIKPGLYVYDVQLVTASNDSVYTIVPESYFELKSEVTY